MRMNLDHVVSGHFVLWKDVLSEFDYWTLAVSTVFARSDAAATIYFIAQFCAAFIRERLLIESGVY